MFYFCTFLCPQQEHIIDALCHSDEDYQKVLKLMDENMTRGLNRETHDKADVSMDITFVREVPNGTGEGFLILFKRTCDGASQKLN